MSYLDAIIILAFFVLLCLTGFLASRGKNEKNDFLLNSRKTGLMLFIATNVSTWYGGILGVGEFTYQYGIVNWFTQGFPYYIFALLFALFFARKVRKASLFTIPERIEEIYGKKASLISALIVFILASPAPYILMSGVIIAKLFSLNLFLSMLISLIFILPFILKGGFKADLFTDVLQFFFMFLGFAILLIFAFFKLGAFGYLESGLPPSHLTLTGGMNPLYIFVWFLIALWTFVDPGFHQRCYSAKNEKTAFNGVIISILLWAFFDFLTTSTALYARAKFPSLEVPQWAYFTLAESILPHGLLGLFYAGIFATILSTLNSFIFISGTTFSLDFAKKLNLKNYSEKRFTKIGMIISSLLAVLLAYLFPSVINLWYIIGSVAIPGLIFAVIGAYFDKFRVNESLIILEMVLGTSASIVWIFIKKTIPYENLLSNIEPMIVGLFVSLLIHTFGILAKKR
ncbi:MAG: sodium:solute symporter family protein [bacterium]|nr:sodium:solute symporter family protein [bacterium]